MPRPDDTDLDDYADGPRRRCNPLLVLAILGVALGVGVGTTVTWAWVSLERAKAEARAAVEAASQAVQEPSIPAPGELEAARREAERRAAEAP